MKKYLFILIPLLIFSILTFLVSCKKMEKIKIAIMPKSYCLIEEEYQEKVFNVEVFCNLSETFITNQENIKSVYVKDNLEYNVAKLKLNEVKKQKEIIFLNNKKYNIYKYSFFIESNINSAETFQINDAFLHFDYHNNQNVKIKLGSFSYTRVPFIGGTNHLVSISQIKGVKNSVNRINTLAGVELKVRNDLDSNIKIKSIESLDKNIIFSTNDLVSPFEILSPSQNINEITNKSYNFFEIGSTNDLNLNINSKDALNFFIPLKYKQLYKTNVLGFVIIYETQNGHQKIIFDNFLFFRDFTLSPNEKSMIEHYVYDFN